jgi:predicted outer membrane protein
MNRAKMIVPLIGVVVSMGAAIRLAAQESTAQKAPPPRAQGQDDSAKVQVPVTADAQQPALSDMAWARWLLMDQRLQTEISTFAQQRTQNPQVKQFAARVAQTHGDLTRQLQQIADEVPGADQQAGQLDDTLQELGEVVQDRLDQPGRGLGIRGQRDAASDTAAPENNDRIGLRERRQAARDQRNDADRRADRDEGSNDGQRRLRDQIEQRREERQEAVEERRDERQEAIDERQDLREQRRQDLRGFLRDNLPEVLDVVGEAIQAEAQQTVNSPWLKVEQQLGERQAVTLKEELGRYQGAEFDQAFLGYQILAHIRTIDAFKLAQQSASDELRQALADGITTVQGQLQQARLLMEQLARDGNSRPRAGS